MFRRVSAFFVLFACLASGQKTVVLDRGTGNIFENECSKNTTVFGEFFRYGGTGNCRDVISCTFANVVAIRCPSGLSFDIEKQVCDWSTNVDNCDQLVRNFRPVPNFDSPTSNCGDDDNELLTCGDGTCVEKSKFCDDIEGDCPDGSDENLCGPEHDPNRAPDCREIIGECQLPDCFCSIDPNFIPGELKKSDTPQMITITFEDSINSDNYFDVVKNVFRSESVNPNGCTIKGTFFVSHEYTNYALIQELYNSGHEIAVHSISHDNDRSYWDNATEEVWRNEIDGQRSILKYFGNVSEISGFRSPLLRMGGNKHFKILTESGFTYDSSIVVPASSNPVPLWPYTLDSRIPHRCYGNDLKCPSRSFPGLWEIPINELSTLDGESRCVFFELCPGIQTPQDLFRLLHHNFLRHYRSNRAPFGIYLNPAWFKANPSMRSALRLWMDRIEKKFKHSAYFVSKTQVLDWMRDPTPISKIKDFEPWKRNCNVVSDSCESSRTCVLRKFNGEERRMGTCLDSCPKTYPWIGDVFGSL